MTQPIYDFTGRGEGGGRVVGGGSLGPIDPYNNEWVRMRQQQNTEALYEALGMVFPIHPALGHQLQELGNMIVDVASGGGTTVAQDRAIFKGKHDPSNIDRVGGLIGTWTGNVQEDIGQALGMTPEDLAKVSRAFRELQSNPEAQGELLRGLGHAMKERYGGEDGPLAAAEDFGGLGALLPAGRAAGITGKLIGKDIVKPVTPAHKGMVNPPGDPPAGGVLLQPREGSWQQPFATPGETRMIREQDAIGVTGARATPQQAPWDPDGDSPEYKAFLDDNEIEHGIEGVHYVEGENVDPAMMPKSKSDFDILNTHKSLDEIQRNIYYENMYSDADIDKAIQDLHKSASTGDIGDLGEWYEDALAMFEAERSARAVKRGRGEPGGSGDIIKGAESENIKIDAFAKLSDDELDSQINEFNRIINSGDLEVMGEKGQAEYKDHLQALVAERHRRRRESGGGSAGAKKQMSKLDQMKAEGAGEPGEGWPVAHGIEGFTGDADFGAEVTDLLAKAQFSTKRNQWIFPDVGAGAEGTFDINGFINRMGNPRHSVNTEELSILGDVLTLASQHPSKRNLSSMAEDLYKMISGTIKERLRADQGKLFDPGTLGFNL